MNRTPAELHEICSNLYEKVAADLKNLKIGHLPGEYDAFLLAEFAHNLIDSMEALCEERDQAIKERDKVVLALKQAKKTLKKALKMVKPKENEEHKPEDCRYYVDQWFYGVRGRCISTMEMDPCKGENCPNWKPKEENK